MEHLESMADGVKYNFRELPLVKAEQLAAQLKPAAQNLVELADQLKNQYWHAAKLLYCIALLICDDVLGNSSLETAAAMISLANLLVEGSKPNEEAFKLYENALAISESVCGTDDIGTIPAIYAMSTYYLSCGKFDESIPLRQRVLSITENVLGPDHTDTAAALRKLAWALQIKDFHHHEIEPLLQGALALTIINHGAESIETANAISALGTMYSMQKNFPLAELNYREALTAAENVLGVDHPDTASFLFNLAGFLADHKPPTEAELLLRRALSITEKALGSEHPDTADYLFNLAEFLSQDQQHDEAYSLYRKALAICENILGTEHGHTLQIVDRLNRLEKKFCSELF